MALVLAHQRLVTMVAVLEEEAAVPILRQYGRRLPPVFEMLLHRFDVLFPFVGRNPNEHVGFRPGEPHEVGEWHRDGPDPPMWSLRQGGGEHDVVAAPTREEVADPDRGATRVRRRTRRSQAETSHSKSPFLGAGSQVVRAIIRSRHSDADVVDGTVVLMKSVRTSQKRSG